LGEPRILATLDLQIAFYLYCLGEEEEAAASLDRAYLHDASFIRDDAFLNRWLRWLVFHTQDTRLTAAFLRWLSARTATRARRVSRKISAARHATELRLRPSRSATLRAAFNCLLRNPSWLTDSRLRRVAVKSLLGRPLAEAARDLRRLAPGSSVRVGARATEPKERFDSGT
jgi:hypothetical protein